MNSISFCLSLVLNNKWNKSNHFQLGMDGRRIYVASICAPWNIKGNFYSLVFFLRSRSSSNIVTKLWLIKEYIYKLLQSVNRDMKFIGFDHRWLYKLNVWWDGEKIVMHVWQHTLTANNILYTYILYIYFFSRILITNSRITSLFPHLQHSKSPCKTIIADLEFVCVCGF